MGIYTYVVEHEDDIQLRLGQDTKINGGKLQSIACFDALGRLEKMEDALNLCLNLEGWLPPATVRIIKEALV